MKQNELQLSSVKHTAPDGIEMGVMNNGTPYLGARGLAALCGVAPSVIITLVKDWETELRFKPRGQAIEKLILEQGGDPNELYVPINVHGKRYHAINDTNCMAILEYYAFDSQTPSDQARSNYRNLAKLTLRTFIYERTGYDPEDALPQYWKTFHERITLNELPSGYFSVFSEIANLVISGIRGGMPFDHQTMPDISVGMAWGKHWCSNEFDGKYGERRKHLHVFPEDFPQRDPMAWIYPVEALGEFRRWMDDVYVSEKFGTYLNNKAKKGALTHVDIPALVQAVQPARLN
ncbi:MULTISPECIES: hypothetical protein [unclassified Vibrio]|uniref:hypothetical protein n=2 Tax=Vibrio TaxID=662 RepID=UPI00159DB1E6|nr:MULTISPECIES: hypothetical protein [unclassified Vibrio]NVN81106.1 hypothetical protein [Vibrio sp. Scap16]QLE95108.1 hypothetical protein FLM53_19080 [Vibrio sp. Scap24]